MEDFGRRPAGSSGSCLFFGKFAGNDWVRAPVCSVGVHYPPPTPSPADIVFIVLWCSRRTKISGTRSAVQQPCLRREEVFALTTTAVAYAFLLFLPARIAWSVVRFDPQGRKALDDLVPPPSKGPLSMQSRVCGGVARCSARTYTCSCKRLLSAQGVWGKRGQCCGFAAGLHACWSLADLMLWRRAVLGECVPLTQQKKCSLLAMFVGALRLPRK